MSLLISKDDINRYEKLPKHLDTDRILTRIKQAQDFDLPEYLPADLIADIITNDTADAEQHWKDLLALLRPALVYFTFARFLEWHDLNVETFGFSEKTNEYSQKLTDGKKGNKIDAARALASGYMSKVIDFLNKEENEDLFASWKCGESGGNTSIYHVI